MSIIEVHDLTRKFKETTAVEGINLEVEEGEVLGFLGAGKTTTIRMLAGIISPTSGYAVVAGHQTAGHQTAGHRTGADIEELHKDIGLLTETPGFYDNLTVRRNLEFYAGFYSGIDAAVQIEKYLKIMGLWEKVEAKVGTFSKGMKQRLALARALLHEPKVLFLDEPTAGLDPEAARQVRDLVKDLSREGRTIFLSTHNLSEAESLCRRIAVVKTRLLALDTVGNLRNRLFQRHVIVRLTSVPKELVDRLKVLPFIKSIEPGEQQIRFELNDPEKDRPALIERIVTAGGKVMSVEEEQHSLEDVYLNLVHEDNHDG